MSSVVHCTSVRDLWNPMLANKVVENCMSTNKFEFIRSILHFTNNSKMKAHNYRDRDRLFKIRPIVGHQNERFSSIPMRHALSVQICATKTRHYTRQCTIPVNLTSGAINSLFCVMTGASPIDLKFTPGKNIKWKATSRIWGGGETGNIVVRPTRIVPRFENYTV